MGNRGSIRSLDDGGEHWPPQGQPDATELPEVLGERIDFGQGGVLDLGKLSFDFARRPSKKPRIPELSPERREQIYRMATQERVEAGAFVALCEREPSKLVLYQNRERVAEREGCGGLLSVDASGERVLLSANDGVSLWQPRQGRFSTMNPPEFAHRRVVSGVMAPENRVPVVSAAFGLILDGTESYRLHCLRMGNQSHLWSTEIPGHLEKVTFSPSVDGQILRAVVGKVLFGWRLSDGRQVEKWQGVYEVRSLDNGKVLAFLDSNQIEFVSVDRQRGGLVIEAHPERQGAIVRQSDGGFEILGNREEVARDLGCVSGNLVLPLTACVERYEWPGLLSEAMAELGFGG